MSSLAFTPSPLYTPPTVIIDNQVYKVLIRRKTSAKQLRLRGNWFSHVLQVSAPLHEDTEEIFAFIQRAEQWILSQKAKAPQALPFEDGTTLSILGQTLTLHLDPEARIPRVRIEDGKLICSSSVPERAIPRFLKELLATHIRPKVEFYSRAVGKPFMDIKLKDLRSRWGSCSFAGSLVFNWKLIFAPVEILEYVIIHEVGHLVHFDHSARFWGLVKEFDPEYRTHRAWLKKHSLSLQAVGARTQAA